ncbi:hypothetical protein S245_036430, partial [Arachis hypogaea]
FRIIVELLNTDKIHQSDLFEVVGKKDLRNLVTTKEKETKRLVVVLEDLEHNKIDYILFEKMVDKIFPHLEDGTVKPVIVLLQFFKAIWKDPLRLLEPLLLLTLVKKTGIISHVETVQRKWIFPLGIDMSVASVATPMEVLHS